MADGLFTNSISNQFEDSRGDIWITQGENLIRWERQTGRMIPYTHGDGLPLGNGAITYSEDSHGNMWFGFYFGGLARYRDGKFQLFTEDEGWPTSQVGDLLTDSRGRLWVATSGHGMFRVDDTEADRPVFKNYSTANGLSSNHPICLTEDRFGRIYIGTGRGINRIDRDGSVKVFTQEDGLPSNYITRCAADKNGNLWFVARNTVVRFVPEIEQTTSPPPVFIDRILVNGVPQNISQLGETETRPLELESTQRQIQVDFFALTFGAGENIRYQYRLDEQDWSAPIKQQTLNLDLAPGKHSLLVRAIRRRWHRERKARRRFGQNSAAAMAALVVCVHRHSDDRRRRLRVHALSLPANEGALRSSRGAPAKPGRTIRGTRTRPQANRHGPPRRHRFEPDADFHNERSGAADEPAPTIRNWPRRCP